MGGVEVGVDGPMDGEYVTCSILVRWSRTHSNPVVPCNHSLLGSTHLLYHRAPFSVSTGPKDQTLDEIHPT